MKNKFTNRLNLDYPIIQAPMAGGITTSRLVSAVSNNGETKFTRSFSGKWARGISNQFMHVMKDNEQHLLEFPIQNTLTKSIRKAAAAQKK